MVNVLETHISKPHTRHQAVTRCPELVERSTLNDLKSASVTQLYYLCKETLAVMPAPAIAVNDDYFNGAKTPKEVMTIKFHAEWNGTTLKFAPAF